MAERDPEDVNPRHETAPPPRRDFAAERAMKRLGNTGPTYDQIVEFMKETWPEKYAQPEGEGDGTG